MAPKGPQPAQLFPSGLELEQEELVRSSECGIDELQVLDFVFRGTSSLKRVVQLVEQSLSVERAAAAQPANTPVVALQVDSQAWLAKLYARGLSAHATEFKQWALRGGVPYAALN